MCIQYMQVYFFLAIYENMQNNDIDKRHKYTAVPRFKKNMIYSEEIPELN